MKLTEKEVATTQRVVVFGEPKSGKTELVGKLSEAFDLLWFDLENGYVTLRKLPLPWQERIEIVSIPDTKTFPIAIETMLKVFTGAKVVICDKHGKVACPLCAKEGAPTVTVELNALPSTTILVIDSLTQLANSAINFLTKNQPDTYKCEWDDYRNQGQLMDKILSQAQQARYNLCCITHVVETVLEDGKKRLVPMAGTTNFSRNTAKYFDHVVYCEVKNRSHAFASSTTFSASVLTGSRSDIAIEAGTVPTLLDIFKGKVEKAVVAPSPAQNALAALKAKQAATASVPAKPAL